MGGSDIGAIDWPSRKHLLAHPRPGRMLWRGLVTNQRQQVLIDVLR